MNTNNTSDISSIADFSAKELDDLWLEVFGWTYRDSEELSWVWCS